MDTRNHNNSIRASRRDVSCDNIPIESIRKTRCLNIDRRSSRVSWEVYKILKSNNGRKIFT